MLTGKGLNWGGSLIRPEATGYGCVYFAQEMLKTRSRTLEGKVCTVSGSGNVAQYTVEKLIQLGAKPVTMSDSNGFIYDKDGINEEKLAWVMDLKNVRRGRIKEYADKFGAKYIEGKRPWAIQCDCAFPCATQNEINGDDAKTLLKNGCYLVAEGANMPTDPEAIELFLAKKILYGPGKAANAGGVATSGLEMCQNSMRLPWTREEVDKRLHQIMVTIHKNAYDTADRIRPAGQPRRRRQHRRLRQGRRRHARPGPGLAGPLPEPGAAPRTAQFLRPCICAEQHRCTAVSLLIPIALKRACTPVRHPLVSQHMKTPILRSFWLAPLCLLMALLAAAQAAPGDPIIPQQPGYLRGEFVYPMENRPIPECHASTLAETPAGLVAAWFGGKEEGSPDVGIWCSRSVNGSWSAPVEVANGVQHKTRRHPCWNPVLYQAKDGPLLLFYKVGPSPSRWWGMLMTSADYGQSWTPPRRLPEEVLGPVKNKPVLLPSGELLCGSSTEHAGWRVHFERTPDLGQTWEITTPANDGKEFDAIQPAILVHADGKLQALGRTRQSKICQVWSIDQGRSWSPMTLTDLPNPNAGIDAVTLQDGRQLLVYNHTTSGRSPLNVAVSPDGYHWQAALILENQPGEYSYPAVIQSQTAWSTSPTPGNASSSNTSSSTPPSWPCATSQDLAGPTEKGLALTAESWSLRSLASASL